MSYGLSPTRVLSRPHEVHFAGFRTDTYRLQQAGWKLSAEQDVRYGRIRLAMEFEPARLYMVSEAQDLDYYRAASGGYEGRPLVFVVRHCASRITVNLMESSFDFKPIDATPCIVSHKVSNIEDLGIFAPLQTRTQEILVEPKDVQECLDLIKRLQAPELAEIRKRNARRNDPGSAAMPMMQTTVHAQVISLAA